MRRVALLQMMMTHGCCCVDLFPMFCLQGGNDYFGNNEDEEGGTAADDDELYRRRPIDQEEEVNRSGYIGAHCYKLLHAEL
jgi:hypothetical protein